MLVMEHTESMKGVTFPTAGVTNLASGVVQHAITVELSSRVELPLIARSIRKFLLPVSFALEYFRFDHNIHFWFLFARKWPSLVERSNFRFGELLH